MSPKPRKLYKHLSSPVKAPRKGRPAPEPPAVPADEKRVVKLDWDAIEAAVRQIEPGQHPELCAGSHVDAMACIEDVSQRWLPYDILEFEVLGIEKEVFGRDDIYGPYKFHGFVDLSVTLRGVAPGFDGFAGARAIIDWKTRGGALDAQWKRRLQDSWQSRLYAWATGANVFIYRGISRKEGIRQFVISISETNDAEVEEYLTGKFALYDSLTDWTIIGGGGIDLDKSWAKLTRWPREMPRACGAWSRTCEMWTLCRNEKPIPNVIPMPELLSYSSLENFALCPEKQRLRKQLAELRRRGLVKQQVTEEDESDFGSAVHRGLACMYSQAFAVPVSPRVAIEDELD